MHRSLSFVFLAGLVGACAGDVDEAMSGSLETGSGEATAEGSTTTAGTNTTTGDSDHGSSTGAVTTEATESSSDDTGAEGWTPYGACMMGECPEEADECHTYVAHLPVHYCTVFCEDVGECPDAPDGQAEPACDPYSSYSYCSLDCGGAKACPFGMGCFEVELVDESVVMRCGWVDG